jgi:hypothetical protein
MARWRKRRRGTRFLIHAQVKTLPPFGEPDVITLPGAPGSIKAGPRDRAVRAIDLRGKMPFHDERTQLLIGEPALPPAARPLTPARPRKGHFDHLAPGTRQFGAAHAYAVVRFVLDVWEQCLGRPIRWYFADSTPVLYVFPRVASTNAWSGPGFLEFGWGSRRRRRGRTVAQAPFCENFDMIAHEVGHLVMKDVVGNPPAYEKSTMYRAHEEAGADLVACVAALCLERVLDAVLAETSGNLLTVNTLSRFAAWAPASSTAVDDEHPPEDPLDGPGAGADEPTEARRFVHGVTIAKVAALEEVNKHELSKPFSAAAYEVLARMFERRLAAGRLIPARLAARAGRPRISLAAARTPEFARHFAPKPFRAALERARDDFGTLLARTWTLGARSGGGLGFRESAANMLRADAVLHGGAHARIIRRAFERRGIVPARQA